MKVCCTCELAQPLEAFHRHHREPDGRQPRCKACTSIADARRYAAAPDSFKSKAAIWKAGNPERASAIALAAARRWLARNPDKTRAQHAVRNAVRDGLLKRLPCEVCGAEPADGHHEDYRLPLKVRWLCRRHHADAHLARRGAV